MTTMLPLLVSRSGTGPLPGQTVPDVPPAARPGCLRESTAGCGPDWSAWVDYFEANAATQRRLEDCIDWGAEPTLSPAQERRWVASLQRFQLGESGDGAHLLRHVRRGDDRGFVPAAKAFVAEERGHARLLRVLLARFGAAPMEAHGSDGAFVAARRCMGVATELAVIAVAEAVAVVYYGRLADGAPDPVIRGVARRILSDELGHLPLVESRIAVDLARWGGVRRALLRGLWWAAGVGGTAVLALDHGAVLADCGEGRWAGVRAAWRSVRDVRHSTYARAGMICTR